MRVLAISSQVAFAPVGNSASVPALQAAGIEVIAIPTIMLSNHPGLGTPSGIRVPAETLTSMLEKLEALGALENLSGILTGYFADADQVQAVAKVIARLKPAIYLCDPVIGDDPAGLYVPQAVAEAIRDHLVPLATILTPNRFEREWLNTGNDVTAHVAERITTSLPEGEALVTELVAQGQTHRHSTPRRKGVPHGTGDLLSGLYLAARVKGATPADALAQAMARLEQVISLSAGKSGLDVLGQASTFLGVDGCLAGWLGVSWDGGASASAAIYSAFADVLKLNSQFIAIDVPIGLPDRIERGGRICERLARAILKGRTASVFSSPARAVLAAETYDEARYLNATSSDGIKLTIQCFHILHKIREVDQLITPALQARIAETHPEVIFTLLNGRQPLSHRKSTPEGQAERRALLEQAGFPIQSLIRPPKSSGWAEDDLIDACACAWSAKRLASGQGLRLPETPDYDARGLRMEICA